MITFYAEDAHGERSTLGLAVDIQKKNILPVIVLPKQCNDGDMALHVVQNATANIQGMAVSDADDDGKAAITLS